MMSKIYSHPAGAYSLAIPDGWEWADQPSNIAFFNPVDGIGAINVSSMKPARGVVNPASIVLEFAPRSIRSELNVIDLESLPGAYVEYQFEKNAWRVWVFCGPTRVFVLSYSCHASARGIEDRIVDEIVGSLKVS
jgi:hypothetical protein